MAGRPRFEEIFPGAKSGVKSGADLEAQSEAPAERNSNGTCSGGPPGAHGTNTAIENWLLHHLRQLYEEVCSEPVPNELSEMIDRFRRRRQDTEAGRENVAAMTPTARQGS